MERGGPKPPPRVPHSAAPRAMIQIAACVSRGVNSTRAAHRTTADAMIPYCAGVTVRRSSGLSIQVSITTAFGSPAMARANAAVLHPRSAENPSRVAAWARRRFIPNPRIVPPCAKVNAFALFDSHRSRGESADITDAAISTVYSGRTMVSDSANRSASRYHATAAVRISGVNPARIESYRLSTIEPSIVERMTILQWATLPTQSIP